MNIRCTFKNLISGSCLNFDLFATQEIVTYLLNNGADVNIKDKSTNKTALHIAAMTNDVVLGTILLRRRPDLTIKDKANRTPIDVAKAFRNVEFLALIEEYSIYLQLMDQLMVDNSFVPTRMASPLTTKQTKSKKHGYVNETASNMN